MLGRYRAGSFWVFTVAVSTLLGCSSDPETPGGGGSDSSSSLSSTSGSSTTGSGGAGGAPGDCVANVVPLELTIADGVADVQAVPARFNGVDGWLGLDTGNPATFVFGGPDDPDYVPYAGDLTIGCETLPVPSRKLPAIGTEQLEGKPVFGVLGIDFFTDHPSEIDYPGARIARYLDGNGPPIDGLTTVPFVYVEPRLMVDVEIDSTPLTLIYDTGAHDTMWVGQDGNPGDEPILIGTADGDTFTAYVGTGVLALGDVRPRTITVLRAPEAPYLIDRLVQLGADGLLGATGMGFRRIVFDFAKEELRLGPLVTPP